MGVYIKGMDMPECCDECELQREDNYEMTDFCIITGKETLYEKGRHKDCPLVEVKTPHGRLIDGDRFYEEFEPNSWSEGMAVSTYIKKAPTVIEAEVE